MDDEARDRGRQHELQIAEYKRKVELANNTVGDEMAENMLLTQEEYAKECGLLEKKQTQPSMMR